MIARLEGVLASKSAGQLIVDVRGVGYEVTIPLTTYYEMGEEGEKVSLMIYTYVREDTLSLFGFSTSLEKQLFLLLIQVAGIGPRLAVTILSGLPIETLLQAISLKDIGRLSTIPGVGKKTAERMALELREKVSDLALGPLPSGLDSTDTLAKDVVSALVNLGYLRTRAESTVSRLLRQEEITEFDVLLKKALKQFSG